MHGTAAAASALRPRGLPSTCLQPRFKVVKRMRRNLTSLACDACEIQRCALWFWTRRSDVWRTAPRLRARGGTLGIGTTTAVTLSQEAPPLATWLEEAAATSAIRGTRLRGRLRLSLEGRGPMPAVRRASRSRALRDWETHFTLHSDLRRCPTRQPLGGDAAPWDVRVTATPVLRRKNTSLDGEDVECGLQDIVRLYCALRGAASYQGVVDKQHHRRIAACSLVPPILDNFRESAFCVVDASWRETKLVTDSRSDLPSKSLPLAHMRACTKPGGY
mmetsp:Transcript_65054/g.172285  ORF Transcript_65054/g.172285 Transcript_65054/m.172285 type:complete len:275 (+) Transcript_65054:1729-2553(+)